MSMVKLLYGRSLHVPGNYRQNEIRNFKGFPFTKDTIKYKDKIEYIKKLTIKDLMIFSSFLCYKHDYLNKVIIQMCNSLIDINTLVITNENMISFVRSFNGIDTYSVQKWITDIEDAATSLTLQEEQKVKLTMKSATGLAKSWLESEGKFQIIRNGKELEVE